MSLNIHSIKSLNSLVIFNINDQEFCSDIKFVSGIIKFNEAKLFVENAILTELTYNNYAYKVVDIHGLYGRKPFELTDSSRIILIEMFGVKFCVFSDRVIEILTTDRILMEESLDFISDKSNKYSRSIIMYRQRSLFYPDFEKIAKDVDIIAGIEISSFASSNLFSQLDLK